MSKSLLVFCILICIMCLTHIHKSCVQSMSVNEITSGSLLADMMDIKSPHHLRHQQHHQQQQQHHHHQPHHHHHHQHNPNKTSESPTPTSTNGRQSPNMWTILGQTVKSHDASNEQSDYENDAKYKEFEQQHLQEKFRREHGTHDTDHAIEHPKKSLSCPKCQSRPELRMTEEELTNLRIEYVKNQILQKLRLTERPQVSASNIPKPVAEGATIHQDNAQEQVKRTPDEFYGKTTQKIVFPKLGEFGFGLFICCGNGIFTAFFLSARAYASSSVEMRFTHFVINSGATVANWTRKRFFRWPKCSFGCWFFGNLSQRILKAKKNVIKKCKYEKPFIIVAFDVQLKWQNANLQEWKF